MGSPSLSLVNKTSAEERWKRGQDVEEEYRSIYWACRDGSRQSQPHLELELVRSMRANKGISISTSAAEGELLLSGLGGTVKDTGKTKGLGMSFVSAFPGKVCSWASQVSA